MAIDEKLESLISVVTEIKGILVDLGDLLLEEKELEEDKNNRSPFGGVNITVVTPDKAKESLWACFPDLNTVF